MIRSRNGWLAAGFLVIAFAALQAATLDYGVRINDTPYVAAAQVRGEVARGSGLERDILVSAASMERENLDLWMLRFKLYPIEADEIVNVIALARINPGERRFDPGFYQYGGAYLYPLGLWFYALKAVHVLQLGSLDQMLADPQAMDGVWIAGRAFVLIAVALSALFLFATLRMIAPPAVALMLTTLYLASPMTIMHSQVMKPHWYGLLWVNIALFLLTHAFVRHRLRAGGEIALGLVVGLAVGSALTFSIFAVMIEIALLGLILRSQARIAAAATVPLVAAAIFVACNPFYFLSWAGFSAERAATQGWFGFSLAPSALLGFVDNSLLIGAGAALMALTVIVTAIELIRPSAAVSRLLAAAISLALVFAASISVTMASWHINFRLVSYALPLSLMLLAVAQIPGRNALLALVLAATAAQAAPLKLAYFDENDPDHSTRLRSAAWIDANIPAGESICLGTVTPTPYETPPFRLGLYRLNTPDCTWKVLFERETDSVVINPGDLLVERFRPRFSPERFPLVFGHINPQVSIYRRS